MKCYNLQISIKSIDKWIGYVWGFRKFQQNNLQSQFKRRNLFDVYNAPIHELVYVHRNAGKYTKKKIYKRDELIALYLVAINNTYKGILKSWFKQKKIASYPAAI